MTPLRFVPALALLACAGQTATTATGADPGLAFGTTDAPEEEEQGSVEGFWVGEDFSCFGWTYWFEDAANELDLDEDGEGRALVFFMEGADCGVAEFDVTLEDESSDEAVFSMDCDEVVSAYTDSCLGLDFEMTCERNDDELDCDGTSVWSSYVFHWDCVDGPCEG